MRNKKQFSETYNYKSIFTGEYVMAHQWIGEVLVDRKAQKEKVALPHKYWVDNEEWAKVLKLQIQQAAKLIRKYSEEAVTKVVRQKHWIYSLMPKFVIEDIEKEQKLIDLRQNTAIAVEVSNPEVFEQRKTVKKSLMGKLNGKT